MSNLIASPTTCFGKIPARGDFVRGNGQHQLIGILDRWVSQVMEQLSEDPRWKIAYDSAAPIDFAFIGARSRVSVVGHLRPSTDASGRRFPFLTAATIERDDVLMFRSGPAALAYTYSALARVSETAVQGTDIPSLLDQLDSINCADNFATALLGDPLGNFVRRTTLEGLATMLAAPTDQTRRIILAIGLLMRPILEQTAGAIDKDLLLPLPADDRQRNLVAALWLYLITAFLRKTTVELQVIIERRSIAPHLIIGFNGAASDTLLATLAPQSAKEQLISLVDPDWIDEQPDLANDYGIAKLAAYLAQPTITLELAINTFREVFLGE